MTISAKVREACQGLKSLAIGLGITGRAFVRPKVTVLYPRQELPNRDSYRGHVELVGREDAPGVPRCVACGACARACPSACLTVACPVDGAGADDREAVELAGSLVPRGAAMAPAPRKGCKTPGLFVLDYSLCSLCGQCAKACPAGALRFSSHVYFVATRREAFRIDLLARLRRQAAGSHPAKESA